MMNTFPKFTEMLPANNATDANARMAYLSARKKPQVVFGASSCTRGIDVENNLLVRQAAPMLLTNGSYAGRELYSENFLTTITSIVNQSNTQGEVGLMGLFMVSVRTRFAGLHRPLMVDSSEVAPYIVRMPNPPKPTGKIPLASDGLEA